MSERGLADPEYAAEHDPSSAAPENAPPPVTSGASGLALEHTAVPLYDEPDASAHERARLMIMPPPATEGMGAARGPPPSYHQATDKHAPPPAYESLYGEIREAKKDSANSWEFIRNVLAAVVVVFGGIGACLLFLGLQLALPITMLTMGIMQQERCPAQPWLSVWLIVGGTLLIYRGIHVSIYVVCTHLTGRASYGNEQSADWVVLLVELMWLGLGCVLVYLIFPPHYSKDAADGMYCDYGLYVTAFVSLHLVMAVAAVATVVCCCVRPVRAATEPLSGAGIGFLAETVPAASEP